MIIRKYRANNMNEALTRIRYELGGDAVIISQRKVRKKGFLGFFASKIFEVTAAVEETSISKNNHVEKSIQAIKNVMDKSNKDIQISNKDVQQSKKEIAADRVYSDEILNKNNQDIIDEMQKMRMMLDEMMNMSSNGTVGKSNLEIKLKSLDIHENLIQNVINQLNTMKDDERDEKEKVRSIVENMISISEKDLKGVVVLVGPTGVGKTTTIAKLAGRLALIEKKKVGLITIDTYRIGAVEQLRTYADIMNIPFSVVVNMKDMQTAVDSMSDRDVVLIDTTGRSSKNKMQISELRAFVQKVAPENVHLVISCTTKDRDVDIIIKGYKQLDYNNIIITKLDETVSYGSILNIQQFAKKPISFVTTGQNVPDDIKIMTREEISRLILGEDIIC